MMRRIVLIVIISVGAGTLFVRLGVWQLHRLAGRRALNALVLARLVGPPVPIAALPGDPDSARFARVRVTGRYDWAHEVRLSGRINNGSPGVDLVTPVIRAGTDTVVMVNRGWVYAPDAATTGLAPWRLADSADITGYVETFPAPLRGDVAYEGVPGTVRWLDRADLSRRIGRPVAPVYVVARDSATGTAAARTPVPVPEPSLDEGPHLNYAIQWFSFAAIALAGMGLGIRGELRARATGR